MNKNRFYFCGPFSNSLLCTCILYSIVLGIELCHRCLPEGGEGQSMQISQKVAKREQQRERSSERKKATNSLGQSEEVAQQSHSQS